MLKSIILFFRKRKIRQNMQHKRLMQFPDINKFPTISILIDENQKKNVKEMESLLKTSLNPKRIRFIMVSEIVPDDMLQNDFLVCISKEDFTKLGVLKKEKEETLRSFSDDLFVNLSDNNEDLFNDYLVSNINSSFKIGHPGVNMKMYDLVMDYGVEKNDVERLKILFKYILMLSGNKNEK